MNDASTAQVLLENCIIDNSDDAWSKFMGHHEALFRRTCSTKLGSLFHEFREWLPGWLFYGRKLHALYRKLAIKVEAGEFATMEDRSDFISNYLSRVMNSAIGDFFRERKTREQTLDPILLEGRPAPTTSESTDNLVVALRRCLREFSEDMRIPFWLKYIQILGQPEQSDLLWIAEKMSIASEKVSVCISDEMVRNSQHKYPLSSSFIASLLDIAPSADGKFSTIDQRVRRALMKIRESFTECEK